MPDGRGPRASNTGYVERASNTGGAQARGSVTGGPRASVTGGPRASVTGGRASVAGGPRSSITGGPRRSHRTGSRRSTRQGAEGNQLSVIDDEGVDRTPKPLMSLDASGLRNAGNMPRAGSEAGSDAMSDASEFFLDRMSDTQFSRRGWESETNSGSATPKSEDEFDGAAARQQSLRLAEEQALAAAAAELSAEIQAKNQTAQGAAAGMPAEPAAHAAADVALLGEADLEKMHYIDLTETETIFMHVVPCITVGIDSEDAKAVEESNKRYAALLSAKQATENYTDQAVQTLDHIKKVKEVQSAVLQTAATMCQATTWDISDTYRSMEEQAADEEEQSGLGAGGLSISQLAGAVGRGGVYQGHPSGQRAGGDGDGGVRSSSGAHDAVSRRETMSNSLGLDRQASVLQPGPPSQQTSIFGQPSVYGAPPGGLPLEADGLLVEAAAAPNPLAGLRDLLPTLELMDSVVAQNLYLPKLLLYRGIQQLAQPRPLLETPASGPPPVANDSTVAPLRGERSVNRSLSRAQSRGPSRPLSRQPSEGSAIGLDKDSLRRMAAAQGSSAQGAGGPGSIAGLGNLLSQAAGALDHASYAGSDAGRSGHGGDGGGKYAASVAESMWPEELLQDLADLGPDGVPHMELLWEWTCPQTQGKKVTCMAWNKKNPDLMAVGYGNNAFESGADHASPGKGIVAFWSLKNPGYPLWLFETQAGVTALDFAKYSPNVLAVGLYDGTVAMYDVRSKQGSPSMMSDATTGRHSDPVWKVRWLDRGHERDELLVSISTDGRVTQWSIAKGLECNDLMKLKRVPRRPQPGAGVLAATGGGGGGGGKGGAAAAAAAAGGAGSEHDAFISRLTSGMSFDFSARDERIYIAGTEDGWIHRCSTSYSEQYLESYQGHMGPVYNVQWSPFRKNMFISASGDWTLRLWQEDQQNALLLFQSSNHEIADVQWCPTNATVFGDVTTGGRLELWDFELSTVKPVITHKAGVPLSCLLFAHNSPVVVCGGENGVVSVFRTHNIDREYDTMDEQLYRLDETIRANVMKQQPGGQMATS